MVGAWAANNQDGCAYIFSRSNNTWTQTATISLSESENTNRNAGENISLSSDGFTALIGSKDEDAAYIFTSSNGVLSDCTETAKLTTKVVTHCTQFGESVSLSSDGSVALVGAYSKYLDSKNDTGAAYIFYSENGTWSDCNETYTLLPNNIDQWYCFGCSVSISGDGSTALIGAYNAYSDNIPTTGAAYIFTYSDLSKYSQTAKLTSSCASSQDKVGSVVCLSSDGSRAFVYSKNQSSSSDTGAVLVFEKGSSWENSNEIAILTPSDDTEEYFAYDHSISSSSDGSNILIGADENVYLFSSNSWTSCNETVSFLNPITNSLTNFGCAVAISADSTVALFSDSYADVVYSYIF